MLRKGSLLLMPYHLLFIFILLFITGFVVWFYRDIDRTFHAVSDQFIRNQVEIAEEFSRNIETRLAELVPKRPVETLKRDEELRDHFDHILSLFSTHHFRYVYLLYLDDRGKLRYLADGSYEKEERGIFWQKFDPETQRWRRALESGEPVYAMQQDFTGLWITFYYPLGSWQAPRYLLVFDVSIDTLDGFQKTLQPIRDLLKVVSVILVALLAMSIVWSLLFYFQKKKNSIDPLTGLYNRNLLPKLEQRVDLSGSSVIIADIDHFKRINDRYGHDAGDRVLQFVARILLRTTRPEDILIRYGGEEFLIIINDIDSSRKVIEIAQNILEEFAKTHIKYNDQTLRVTLSMGVVPVPGGQMDLNEAILHADKMLYIAKTTGRNRVVVYGEEQNINRRLLFHEVHEAIREGQLFFEYQPIVDARNFRIVKHEVLARLERADGKIHYPNEFIPPIRGTGLYRELSKLLLKKTFETIRRENIHLSINFDINDFLDETLFEVIFDQLNMHAELAQNLTIELLEEHHIEDIDELVERIERLKSLGIEIAIDDFGKGYAGLNYILEFRPAVIKVDRELVSQVLSHPDVSAILKSIVDTGHIIGIKTVAEGIDDPEVLQKMREIGFDCLQGFYLAKPSREPLKTIDFPHLPPSAKET